MRIARRLCEYLHAACSSTSQFSSSLEMQRQRLRLATHSAHWCWCCTAERPDTVLLASEQLVAGREHQRTLKDTCNTDGAVDMRCAEPLNETPTRLILPNTLFTTPALHQQLVDKSQKHQSSVTCQHCRTSCDRDTRRTTSLETCSTTKFATR